METKDFYSSDTYSPNNEFCTENYRPNWVMKDGSDNRKGSSVNSTMPIEHKSWFSQNKTAIIILIIIAVCVKIFESIGSGSNSNARPYGYYDVPSWPSETRTSGDNNNMDVTRPDIANPSMTPPSVRDGKILVPENKFPKIKVPEFKTPEIKLPKITLQSNPIEKDKLQGLQSFSEMEKIINEIRNYPSLNNNVNEQTSSKYDSDDNKAEDIPNVTPKNDNNNEGQTHKQEHNVINDTINEQ